MTEARRLLARAQAVLCRLSDDESGQVYADVNAYLIQPSCEGELVAALVAASRHKHDVGEKWETINCRLCFSSWKLGAEEAHYPDCVFADEDFARDARAALAQGKKD